MLKNINIFLWNVPSNGFFICIFSLNALFIFLYLVGIRGTNFLLGEFIKLFIWITLPLALIVLILAFKPKYYVNFFSFFKSILLVVIGVVYLLLIFVSLIQIDALITGSFATSHLQLQILRVESSDIIVYRTNYGATTDFGIEIRKEKSIFPGFKMVRVLQEYYHVYDLKLELFSNSQVKIKDVVSTSHVYTVADENKYGSFPVKGEIITITH